MGGALPSHLGYNRARRAVEHDWLWSVGNNPFSGTARGSRLSETHRDWVHRSYALTAIDASAAKVNAGVRALSRVTPCAEGWESLQRWDAPAHPASLTHVHRGVAESWMAIADAVGRLNFADAARLAELSSYDYFAPERAAARRTGDAGVYQEAEGAGGALAMLRLSSSRRGEDRVAEAAKPKVN